MRHRKREKHLGRTSSHRKALRRNLAISLFTYGRIVTTKEKAKFVRPFVEKIVTLAKKGVVKREERPVYIHYYRQVLSRLNNKEVVRKLFGEGKWRDSGGGIAQRYLERSGGYTRILRLSGSRMGVLTGSSVGDIPELEYKMEGLQRKLRLVGNRLGDNASQVIFELVEDERDEEKEVQPKVTVSQEKK